MKKIAIFREKRFENNNFYNLKIDKNLSPFLYFAKYNWIWNTISIDLLEKKEDRDEYIILCFLTLSIFTIKDYIKLFFKYPKNKKYLFLFEPKVVAPLNYNKIIHLFFDKIYTWDDSLVNNKKYFKFIWPQSKNSFLKSRNFKGKKLLTLINWNKASFIKNELYSERENAIRYFEKNNIKFDLYGTNWDKKNLKQKLFWFTPYKSYKWKVDDKIETLSNYKFNICFENMKGTPWYITEKIWDSFKAKSVPIYWWASNITDYVPEECFIDFRKFNWDFDKLTQYISNITENEYNNFIKNIEDFLQTERAQKWFDEKWAVDFTNNL